MGFADLRTRYSTSEPVIVRDLPPGTASVICRTAFGTTRRALFEDGAALLSGLPAGTHVLESWSRERKLLAEEYTTVSEQPGDDPVMGFATSFVPERVDRVLSWLRGLRCTVVQAYDWMQRYSAPLPGNEHYANPLARQLSRSALKRLVSGVRGFGAVVQAYAPVCAAEPRFAESHPDWLLFRSDGSPQHLGDLLQIMDPANTAWQAHWLAAYGVAADAIGFDGFHLDTYGYPRRPFDVAGRSRSIEHAYRAFVTRVRAALPSTTLSFNQVNGVPSGFAVPAPPAFRYVEVWPPNDRWCHLEGLIGRASGRSPRVGGVLALYPPVWDGDRVGAVHTVALTEAVTTALGNGLLVLGDNTGVLCDSYYPDHERLRDGEAATILDWHRFALRCRDLFRQGKDTSWCEVGDENGAVRVQAPGALVSPEPGAGTLFARVVRTSSTTAISCIDLSGSRDGSWSQPTAGGTAREAHIEVLVAEPDRCRATVAVLGAAGGRFRETQLTATSHREGQAVELRLPIIKGWSVALLEESRGDHSGATRSSCHLQPGRSTP
ncbi:MAG: glycoside hydrolase family 66 protein [Acidimicrobiales bacterium]